MPKTFLCEDQKIPSEGRANTRGGMGGVAGYLRVCGDAMTSWNYVCAGQYFLELLVRGAIQPTWNFARLAQYNRTWNFVRFSQYNHPPRLAP